MVTMARQHQVNSGKWTGYLLEQRDRFRWKPAVDRVRLNHHSINKNQGLTIRNHHPFVSQLGQSDISGKRGNHSKKQKKGHGGIPHDYSTTIYRFVSACQVFELHIEQLHALIRDRYK